MMNLKAVLLGDDGIGKTSYLMTKSRREFTFDYIPTVFDSWSDYLVLDETTGVSFGVWDTVGSPDYDILRRLSFPQTDIYIFAFSLASLASFENVSSRWIPYVLDYLRTTPSDLGPGYSHSQGELLRSYDPETETWDLSSLQFASPIKPQFYLLGLQADLLSHALLSTDPNATHMPVSRQQIEGLMHQVPLLVSYYEVSSFWQRGVSESMEGIARSVIGIRRREEERGRGGFLRRLFSGRRRRVHDSDIIENVHFLDLTEEENDENENEFISNLQELPFRLILDLLEFIEISSGQFFIGSFSLIHWQQYFPKLFFGYFRHDRISRTPFLIFRSMRVPRWPTQEMAYPSEVTFLQGMMTENLFNNMNITRLKSIEVSFGGWTETDESRITAERVLSNLEQICDLNQNAESLRIEILGDGLLLGGIEDIEIVMRRLTSLQQFRSLNFCCSYLQCSVDGFPIGIRMPLPHLVQLYITRAPISAFSELRNLRKLVVLYSTLTSDDIDRFSEERDFPSLRILFLIGCKMSNSNVVPLFASPKLVTIGLYHLVDEMYNWRSEGLLEGLDSLPHCFEFEGIEGDESTTLIPKFIQASRLEDVRISIMRLEGMSQQIELEPFFSFPRLKSMRLSWTLGRDVSVSFDKVFGLNCFYLRFLTLGGTSIPERFFRSMPCLECLEWREDIRSRNSFAALTATLQRLIEARKKQINGGDDGNEGIAGNRRRVHVLVEADVDQCDAVVARLGEGDFERFLEWRFVRRPVFAGYRCRDGHVREMW